MKIVIAAIAAASLLTGCASMQRLTSYGTDQAQAQILVQGRRMNLYAHPNEAAVLVGMTVGDAAGGGFVEGLTFGLAKGFKPDPRAVDASLAAFVAPTGCRVSPVREIGSDNINFEANYSCPTGVDLRALMRTQRSALMRGEPIQMP